MNDSNHEQENNAQSDKFEIEENKNEMYDH